MYVCACLSFHLKMTKCHREISESGAGTYAFLRERWSWIVKEIGLNGKKRQSKINKKCGINEMECGGREMSGSEI